jgi:heterodisulfide reductase subunit C
MKDVVKLKKAEIQRRAEVLIEEVMRFGGTEIKRCIQCGSCMSVCPVAITGFDYPNKKLFKLVMLGLREEVLEDPSPWVCVACGRCIEVCSQNVNPMFIYFAFRRIQVREFSIPAVAREALRLVYETGHAIPVSGVEKVRKKLGLPEIPKSTLSNPDALREVQKILKGTDIAELGIVPSSRV